MSIRSIFIYFILIIYIYGCGGSKTNRPLSLSTISISPLSTTYEESIDFDNLNRVVEENIIGVGYIEYEYDSSGNIISQMVEEEKSL